MHRKTLTWSVVVLAAATSMWACGSDDDGGPDGSGGASAGAGGAKAQAGGAGKAQGGGNNNAGAKDGGANNGGADNGGNAGIIEGAGAGGDNVGGDSAGGAGGDSAGGSAGDSTEGGAGGAPSEPTLLENCTAICAAQTTLSCSFGVNCVTACVSNATDPDFPTDDIPGYEKMIACEGKHLTTVASYECSVQAFGDPRPAPKAGTQCEPSICAWSCKDMTGLADSNVLARCCP